jgi:hypothetical protein
MPRERMDRKRIIASLVAEVVDASSRRAWAVVLLALLLAGLALAYTVQHIAIDTDNEKLFSPYLPWRKAQAVLDEAFPQHNNLIVVVDGATPELAEAATAALTQRLRDMQGLFRRVSRPDGGPFFDRNGLLFLPPKEVERTTQQLIAAQPLLGPLAADPTLRGVMDTIARLMDGVSQGAIKLAEVDRPLRVIGETLQGVLSGQPRPMSWRSLITGEPPSPRELRRFILVQPELDFSSLQPGARASDAIRQAARDLGLTPEHWVRVRLTGPVPLSDEELASLTEGADRNAALTVLAVVLLLWMALRSARIIVAILATITVGLVLTAAFGLLAIGPFNLISVAFAVLFVGKSD